MTIKPSVEQHTGAKQPPYGVDKPPVDMTLIALAQWLGRYSAKKISSKQSKPTHTIH
jgi:hypothetical protein